MVVAMTKLIINLSNGQSIQTQSFTAADLSGAINTSPQPGVVTPTDLYTNTVHTIVTAHITDFYEVNV